MISAFYQVELHPFWRQDELVKFCQSKGIHVSAHTPLGVPTSTPGPSDSGSGGEDEPGTPRISFRRSRSVHGPMLKLSVVAEIADRHKKTPEQVRLIQLSIIRYVELLITAILYYVVVVARQSSLIFTPSTVGAIY